MPSFDGLITCRPHGPEIEAGNSKARITTHSGGMSQLLRATSSRLAASPIFDRRAANGSGKGNVSKQVVGV